MKRTIYLKADAENALLYIFDYLRVKGDIPANATDIGEYRAQCISFAINYTVGGLAVEDAQEVKRLVHS